MTITDLQEEAISQFRESFNDKYFGEQQLKNVTNGFTPYPVNEAIEDFISFIVEQVVVAIDQTIH